jgi:2-oxoglutarate ferredoxin oxidoreductase subunit beta
MHDYLNTVDKPLNELGDAELVPGAAALEKFNAAHR